HRVWSVLTAQVYCSPASGSRQFVPVPTSTGVLRSLLSPSPSSPLPLEPQHHRVPFVWVAQACQNPTLTAFQVVPVPTWTTLVWSRVKSPCPVSPAQLAPQHHSVPSVRVPQKVSE